ERDGGADPEQQGEVGVGDGEQTAEHDGFHLVDVEALRDGDEEADAEPEAHRQEDADERVRRQRCVALHVDHRQGREEAEPEDAAVRRIERLAEHEADGETREGRLPERRREEREPPGHDHMAHPAEERREQAAREERVPEDLRKDAAAGECGEPLVEGAHGVRYSESVASARARPSASTAPGGPVRRTVVSMSVTRSATRLTCPRSCETISTLVRESRLSVTTSSSSCRTAISSSPLDGSSSSSSSGAGSIALARSTFWSSPPDNPPSGRFRNPPRPTRSSSRSRCAR